MNHRSHAPRATRAARHRRRRPGFILLFGTRSIVSDEPGEPVRTACPRCAQVVDLRGRSVRQWFTLFFLPVFPISGKTRFTECGNCRAQFELDPHELRARLAAGEQEQGRRAIALYNSLRASPANSVTLNELLQLYASMGELEQAVGAARQFPDALNNSEQCMSTLGRVYLARDQHADAIGWFDAALARNPALGEAHYHKALAHLLSTPPDYERAVTSARAARSAGFPNADALLREAESKARGG